MKFFCPNVFEFLSLCAHLMTTFDHPFLSHFKLLFDNFFLHDFYLPQNFHCKWSATSCSDSSKKCNFKSCPKLQRLNFQHWHFLFVSHPHLIYLFYQSELFLKTEKRASSKTVPWGVYVKTCHEPYVWSSLVFKFHRELHWILPLPLVQLFL
jgi:hypothetical protein